MSTKTSPLILRVPDPFDGSAQTRLTRMGVLNSDGQIDRDVMSAFAGIFSALFYDDLCDFYDDANDLRAICQILRELNEKQETQHMYLFVSIQYDTIRKPLPDPVWWLAGDNMAVRAFMTLFMERLEFLMTEAGLTGSEEEVNAK